MARSILAVLAGWGIVGVFVVLTDMLLMKLFPTEYSTGKPPSDQLAAVSLVTSSIYSIAGGWLTARIAASKPWHHVLALIVWGEIMGMVSMAMTWGQIQAWYQIGLIVMWLPAVVTGGWLRAGKPRFSPVDAA